LAGEGFGAYGVIRMRSRHFIDVFRTGLKAEFRKHFVF